MEKLHDIDDKAKYEEAYYQIGRCLESFNLLAPNINRNLCEIVQHIYGRYDSALYAVYRASNTYDLDEKLGLLAAAHQDLFFQQASFFSLVRSHGCTVGQANVVIDLTRDAYTQLAKWKKSLMKANVNLRS